MIDFAVDVAREAGNLIRNRVGSDISIGHKGVTDLVTDVDLASEACIRDAIASHYPRHQVLAEEGGITENASDYRWIIDPLDGTTNFAHSFPFFAVSIALEYRGGVILGVVYDPNRDETFTAERGGGAMRNGRSMHVSLTAELGKSLLVTGFPYDIRTNKANNLDYWMRFAMSAQAVRRTGSASLDLCYVACGRFEGFWELTLSPWDSAAGALIVTEAGGTVTDMAGGAFSNYKPGMVASNGLIHSQMIGVIAAGE